MRDDSYLESGVAAKAAVRKWRNGALTAAGALASLAILVGVVTWTYRLGMRDAADIPVIRAETGPTRVRPEEPGGQDVAHQDRVVYDVISGGQGADAPAAAMAPAPQDLAVEDLAPSSLSPNPSPRPNATTPEAGAPAGPETAATAETGNASATETAPGETSAPAGAEGDPLAAAVAAAVAEVMAGEGEGEGEAAAGQAPRYAPPAPP
ncbi:MAG: hypothetical protein ACK5MQ_12205, partial [Pikeienuella sp.]